MRPDPYYVDYHLVNFTPCLGVTMAVLKIEDTQHPNAIHVISSIDCAA